VVEDTPPTIDGGRSARGEGGHRTIIMRAQQRSLGLVGLNGLLPTWETGRRKGREAWPNTIDVSGLGVRSITQLKSIRKLVEWYEQEGNLVEAKRARRELALILSDPNHRVDSKVRSGRQLKFKTTHKRKIHAQQHHEGDA
jgi:hypothetical protein